MENLNVQTTNDDSIVSKDSCCTQGYYDDPFIRSFIAGPQRRAPLINRGYYLRLKLFRSLVFDLVKRGDIEQVVSLGCGFDTLYFDYTRKHAESLQPNSPVFFELDFLTLVKRKAAVINGNPALLEMLPHLQTGEGRLTSSHYHLNHCDLRKIESVTRAFRETNIKAEAKTIIMFECVLQYIKPKHSNKLLKFLKNHFPHAIIISYEQSRPWDAFGSVMMKMLQDRDSFLHGMEHYNSPGSFEARYFLLGYTSSLTFSLDGVFEHLHSDSELDRIRAIEPFDEHEECNVKCKHYVFCIATTRGAEDFACPVLDSLTQFAQQKQHRAASWASHEVVGGPIETRVLQPGTYKGWAHTTTRVPLEGGDYKLFCIGGFSYASGKLSRNNSMIIFNSNGKRIGESTLSMPFSQYHTSCFLGGATIAIFGGRNNPSQIHGTLHLLDTTSGDLTSRTPEGTWPCNRYRHGAIGLEIGGMALFGGRAAGGGTLDDFWVLEWPAVEWRRVQLEGGPVARFSPAICEFGGQVFIHGGLNYRNEPLDDMWALSLDGTARRVSCGLPAFFSHTLIPVGTRIYVLGDPSDLPYSEWECGESTSEAASPTDQPVDAVTTTEAPTSTTGSETSAIAGKPSNRREGVLYSWAPEGGEDVVVHQLPFRSLFSRHTSTLVDQGVLLSLGGGCQCFAFGDYFNDGYLFNIAASPDAFERVCAKWGAETIEAPS